MKETDHLNASETFSFIRKRARGAFASYGLTDVKVEKNGERVENKRILSAREYEEYLQFRDESRHQVIEVPSNWIEIITSDGVAGSCSTYQFPI